MSRQPGKNVTTLQGSERGMLDGRPIKLAGFSLTSVSAVAVGRPTLDQWTHAAQFAAAVERASPYWVGDLLAYAEDRADWTEKIDQAMAVTGLARQTMLNLTYVARHVGDLERKLAPTLSHAKAVASLDTTQQRKLLRRAVDEELTVSETSKEVQKITRPKIIEGQAVLKGKYRVLLADCPWEYDNNRPMPDGSLTPAENSYQSMSTEEICKLPIEAHALKDAVLFQWATNAHLADAILVGECWGFKYKTNWVWNKVKGRPGPYGYMHHELLLIMTRGACTPDVAILQHDHASVMTERREGPHSTKPACARKQIESLYTHGPYLELFARDRFKGWDAFGNDAKLWKAGA